MAASGKKEFEKWYEAEKEKVGEKWNLREEMMKYCINDVDILRKMLHAIPNNVHGSDQI